MITVLRFPKGYQFFDANGLPLALGKLSYFIAGTTSPQDTYSDASGNTPNTNPVLLDGSGRLSTDVNLGPSANYKEILTASSGATVSPWPVDNIPKASSAGSSVMVGASSGAAGNAGLVPQPQAGDQAKFLRADATWQTLTSGGQSSAPTNISVTQTSTAVTLTSSTGSGANIPTADPVNAGVMSAADKVKLNGIAAGATVQQNADWNAGPGASQILNKPALGTAAFANVPISANAALAQVVTGNDTRLSDSRSPNLHAATHAATGSDPVTLTATQVSGIPAALAGQNLDNLARVGIGTTDTNNKFSVSGPSVLFANNGDMRATISKGAAANTASFNFQDNFSTRVQFGLLGDDNFGVQTSPDGTAFKAAIVADKTTGAVTLPNTPGFTGDTGAGGTKGLVPAPAAGDAAASKFLKADGTWSVTPTGSSGEANTASNQGASGVGVFKQKSGVDLQFKKVNAASSRVTIVDNTANGTVDLDVSVAGLGLSTVATSGAYSDLSGKPAIPAAQVNSDWAALSGISQILNKPTIPAAQVPSDWASTTSPSQILNKPALSTVATSGKYTDLTNQPTIPATFDQLADGTTNRVYTTAEKTKVAGLATVATSGKYTDLTNQPTIPAAQVNSDWAASTGIASILNKPALATVATSGSYTDLSSKPTIPAAQVNSDWNASTGVAQILNKPVLGTSSPLNVPASGNATSAQVVIGTDTRLSDARTPTAHTHTVSQISDSSVAGQAIVQAANASAQTALLSALIGASASVPGTKGLVPPPSAGQQASFLRGDGTWATAGGGSVDGTVITPSVINVRDTSQAAIAAQSASKFQIVEAALQTTDGTTQALFSIPIANGETVMVRAFVNAMLSDASGTWFAEVFRIFRSPSSGNAVVVGANYSYCNAQKDATVNTSTNMTTAFLTAGLTNQIVINIAGEAGKTYNWFGTALVMRLKP